MSGNGQYLMQNKDFDRNIRNGWTSLLQDDDFCDVTLVSDGNQIKAHKIVLSTFSPVLGQILKKNPHQHPLIYLLGLGISPRALDNLIDFMYRGEIRIPQDEINELLNLANILQVVGLSENEESIERSNTAIVSKRNKIGSLGNNKGLVNKSDLKKEDTIEHSINYGYQENDNDIFFDNLKDIKQNIPKTEFLAYNSNTEKVEQNMNDLSKKVYKCAQCDSKFTALISLKRHIKSIHEGIKFKCEKCPVTATQSTSLNRHMQAVHENIRYDCDRCDYSSTQKSSLNKHLKKKHSFINIY